MSDIMAIAYSGVRAYQAALTTVSENISNANTAGYTRRTTTINEVAVTSGMSSSSVNGQGAIVSGIVRSTDEQKSAAVRNSGADLAKTQTSATWLDQIQSALTGNGLSDQITDFFNSAKSVAADPTSTAQRANMLESASSVASAFASTGQALQGAASDLDASAEAAVSQLSTLSAGLAKINSGLATARSGTSGQAALLDQRDQLLEQMSAITDVNVSMDSLGRATVTTGGANGALLVHGDAAATVTYVRNDAGVVSYASHMNGQTQSLQPSGGALAGYSEAAQRVASANTALNGLAQNFADQVNAVQANGRDLNGSAGAAMFQTGTPASDMTMVLNDPNGIAAASAGGGARDNSNLTALQNVRTASDFEGTLTSLVSANAATLSARQTVASAQSAIHDNAVSARDAATGVNIDEEAVNLMRFQQAYSASSRVIQVARDTLNSILQIQ